MLGIPMPWPAVPCHIWLPQTETDAARPTYATDPDIETTCCYAPGRSEPMTGDFIEDGRPNGDEERMLFFLPKSLDADLRGALIAAVPADDTSVAASRYAVVGAPKSYQRSATPGDYSWCVEGVRFLG